MSRGRADYLSTGKVVYERFCERHPEVSVTYKQWKAVLKAYNTKYREHVVTTGDKVKLPWGMGPFAISKKKVRRSVLCRDGVERVMLPIDWKRSKELGKRVYHLNLHTNGYAYYWYWFVQESRLPEAGIWVFKPCRDSSRAISFMAADPRYIDIYKQWKRR